MEANRRERRTRKIRLEHIVHKRSLRMVAGDIKQLDTNLTDRGTYCRNGKCECRLESLLKWGANFPSSLRHRSA